MANLAAVFGSGKEDGSVDLEKQTEKLYAKIGQLEVENDYLKKNLL